MVGLFRRKSVRISVFGKTDPGRVRTHNEDRFLVADLSRENVILSPDLQDHELGKRGSLLLVADGMGGAAAGEVASEMAASAIYTHLIASAAGGRRFALALKQAVERANEEIRAHVASHPELEGMGTTATAAGLVDDEVYVAQVGDSRAYVVRGDAVAQITRDQSLTQQMVDNSQMTPEEAARSERRNVILQALGPSEIVEVEVTRQQLRDGDVLVLCSDGLTGHVRDDEILDVVTRTRDPAVVCEDLVELANSRGGRDNITVVVARVEGNGLRDAQAGDPLGPQSVQP